ncbi:unnamed protein product [Mytilus edulis]|uniref:SUEL-type lectin domain-containing protein n=1 Tax=Mytilus edulis TaxID=6550 RepID=A0A8S3UHL2_MYTED|nr:unnamed protein product [Mytilus edulis]
MTSGNEPKDDVNNTYDHFLGEQTEDQYDIADNKVMAPTKYHITKSPSSIPDGSEKEINMLICQTETLNITCPNNFVIVFDDANFGRGRSDSQRCREWWGIERTHCDNHKQTLKVLNDKCHVQQKCFLPVNKDIFGNPCAGVSKYLKVKYHCQREVYHASMDMIIVVSALVSISIAASVTITVLCYQRHQSKHSLTRPVRQDQIITERVDSSDYTAINYNEMTDMSLPETNENYYETPREPQAITDIIEQTGDTLTEYESLSNNRTSVEHVYELESTQNNQYQLLTTQRNLSEHTYESTEPELPATTESDLHQLL